MKNLIFAICLAISTSMFAQTNDLTKKQAYENFKNSNNRKELKIPISDFKMIYKQANCIKKNWNVDLKEMPIFQIKKTDEYIENGQFRQSIFGLGDTTFPKYRDDGKPTITCGAFNTYGN